MGYIKLSEEVVRARKEAQKARESKTLQQVMEEIRQERKAREEQLIKRLTSRK